MARSIFSKVMWVVRATVSLVVRTLVLGSKMRQSAIMRHSIVFLVATFVALVAVGTPSDQDSRCRRRRHARRGRDFRR